MGKGKLQKFADMAENPLVVECPYGKLMNEGFDLTGKWHEEFFGNDNPIVLELGCGRGEYTVGLGRQFPKMNFIGVDIKGSRMWHGAEEARKGGLKNVGFLRTNIECIDKLFGEDEVSEIWLTFSDPQMKKPTKRLTSTYFLEKYRRFVKDSGKIHVKTDSNFLFTYTKLMAEHNHLQTDIATDDLYGLPQLYPEGKGLNTDIENARALQTYYEQMWLEKGLDIKYICFRLPKEGKLEESGIEIPMDDYRSYDHEMVKKIKMAK